MVRELTARSFPELLEDTSLRLRSSNKCDAEICRVNRQDAKDREERKKKKKKPDQK